MAENFEHTAGLKIDKSFLSANVLFCIKKTTNMSLSEIKEKIANGDYLLLVDAAELKDLQVVNKLKRELVSLGVTIHLYLDGEEEPSEFFDNIEQTCIDISNESDCY
jgi:hypothetical protein